MRPPALILFISVVLFLASCTNKPGLDTRSSHTRYNILFIVSDDLNTDIGPYGNVLVKTPNIDRLARNGVTFTHAYVQYPLCGPSRASLLTGLRPDSVKVFDLKTPIRMTVPETVTLPQLFKNNGYESVRLGKMFHYNVPGHIGTDGMDDAMSWSRRFNPRGRDWYAVGDHNKPTPGFAEHNPEGMDYEIDELVEIGPRRLALDYLADRGADAEQTDAIMAHSAVEQLEAFKEDGKPFFLAVGFFRPHYPSIAPRKYFDMYPMAEMTLAPRQEGDYDDIPDAAYFINPPGWGLTEEQEREARRGYYASVSFMDAQLGRVLDAVERLGFADNTIIVFLSDHGYNLGEHGQWLKQSLFEKSAKAPLIISVPGGLKGATSARIVEYLDIYPTLAALAGLETPNYLQGKTLVPLLNNPDMEWNFPAFTQTGRSVVVTGQAGESSKEQIMGRSIRTERWRYTEWDDGRYGAELYDHQNDPNEFTNLAGDPAHKADVENLKTQLRNSY